MKFPFVTLFIILTVSAIFIAACSSKPSGPGQYDSLAQCMTAAGAIMHGTEWCPHCQNQKKMFGSSFQYITYIDCDKNSNACIAAGVEGYPTWTINGTNYPGEQTVYNLAKYSGCMAALTNSSG